MRKVLGMARSCVLGRRCANERRANVKPRNQASVVLICAPRMDRLKHRYIVVEGPIGVGKTTLTRALCKRFRGRGLYEVVEENPFLSSFYQDRFKSVTVSDYLFAKDRIFASITLDSNELSLYERVYEHLGPRVLRPDLVIYLQARLD